MSRVPAWCIPSSAVAGETPALPLTSRWVLRACRVHVDEQLLRGESGRIAVAITRIVCSTTCSDVAALGRLGELPYACKRHAALGRRWSVPRKGAARRGRTRVIRDPVRYFSGAFILANVFGGNYRYSVSLGRGNSRTVDACAKSAGIHTIDPGIEVGLLLREHAAAFLLVEKDERSLWKSFSMRGNDGSGGIGAAQCGGVAGFAQFCVQTAIEEHKESESGLLDCVPLAHPRVVGRARRHIQPIARERESSAQTGQIGIAGILVAIESKIRGVRTSLARLDSRVWLRSAHGVQKAHGHWAKDQKDVLHSLSPLRLLSAECCIGILVPLPCIAALR